METPEELPDIIAIMDETFSDPAVLGEFETNKDYMPFIHSILRGEVANTISGYTDVSVLGGNTANSEFEFLTGNSMAFFPNGSVPYLQYIRDGISTIVPQLESMVIRHMVHIHTAQRDGIVSLYMILWALTIVISREAFHLRTSFATMFLMKLILRVF